MSSRKEKSEDHKELVTCSHCGNKTTHNVLKKVDTSEEVKLSTGEKYDVRGVIALAQCTTCDRVSLYHLWMDDISGDPDENYLETVASLLYPASPRLDTGVPEKVRRNYEEAKKVEKSSPYAFAVLTRKTLEQICIDKKARGRNLKEKIKYLAEQDIVPGNLATMAQTLRFLGNLGAHSSDYEFDEREARAMGEFIVAVIELRQ